MTELGVSVLGLDEALKALRAIGDGADREIRKELRGSVGKHFADDVKKQIDARRLVKTGRLRGSIRPGVRGSDVVIRSSPALKPGRKSAQGYAAVYEFGHGGARSFLDPTHKAWLASGKLESELGEFIDWLAEEWRK